MTTERNKQRVEDFFSAFSRADVPACLDMLTDDMIWRTMGYEGGAPMSNKMVKAEISDFINVVRATFIDGLSFEYVGWTAEGDRVAVEMQSYGKKPNGTEYRNPYHFLIRFSGDKIVEIKEYLDTLHVKSVFVDDQA